MQPSLRPLGRSALSLISTRHGVRVYFSTHKASSKSGPVCHSGTFTQWNLYESKSSNWIRIRRLCHCTYNINSVCIKTLTNVSFMSPIDDSWSRQNLISRTIVGYKQKGKLNKHSNASRFSARDIWSTEKPRACVCMKRATGSSMVCSLWSCYRGECVAVGSSPRWKNVNMGKCSKPQCHVNAHCLICFQCDKRASLIWTGGQKVSPSCSGNEPLIWSST